MQEKLKETGSFDIQLIDAETQRIIQTIGIKNQLTAINQTIRNQMLMGSYSGALDALQIKYFAFGDGTATPTTADTQLQNELYRKQITQISNPTPNLVQSVVSLGTTEANFMIREIGVFCGADATTTRNSGTLLARVVVNIEKNSSIVMNIVRSDICAI